MLRILTESRYGAGGRRLYDEVRQRARGAKTWLLDAQVPQTEIESLLAQSSGCNTNVLALFSASGAFRGNVSLPGAYPALLAALRERGARSCLWRSVVLILFGLARTQPLSS